MRAGPRVSVVGAAIVAVALGASCSDTPPDREAAPAASRSPSPSSTAGPLTLVLEDRYVAGTKVPVRLHNAGDVAYVYNPDYEACNMTYLDDTGRKFLVPEGTHCDLISFVEIEPGETVTLFTWDLDECTKDEWGCVEEEPLDPGRYTIKGRFRPAAEGDPARVEATFTITS